MHAMQTFSRGAASSIAIDQAQYLVSSAARGRLLPVTESESPGSADPRNCRRHSTANNGVDHVTAPPGAPPGGAGSLARAAASGTKWIAVSQAGRVIAQLIGMVLLARLLSPSDFGVVAMAMARDRVRRHFP